MENKKCPECGAYGSHSPECSLMDLDTAKTLLKQYYQLWLDREQPKYDSAAIQKKNYLKTLDKYRSLINILKGKFAVVKLENNTLRKKLIK